jgi:hypothetical protein
MQDYSISEVSTLQHSEHWARGGLTDTQFTNKANFLNANPTDPYF